MRTVTLYTKPGCRLCEAVAETIAAAARQRPFRFVTCNILEDPDTFERFKHAIPVVTVEGREVARHRLSQSQLFEALERLPGAAP